MRPVTSSSNYQFGGREGHAAFNFTADKAGDYTVAGRYPRGENGVETVIAVGKGFVELLVGTILGALGLAFGGAGLAIYLFLRTLIRRRRAGFSF